MFTVWIEEFWGSLLKRWPAWPPQPLSVPASIREKQASEFAPELPAPAPDTESAKEHGSLLVEEEIGEGEAEATDEGDGEEEVIDWPAPSAEEIAAARQQAEAEALSGPHRIFLSTPAGPGSLSEALKRLEEAGLVVSSYVDDGSGEPHLAYHPV